jgi:hypothetical protein
MMEVGTLTVTVEDKQEQMGQAEAKEVAQFAAADAAAKAKEAKLAP